jgi:hypothetical protein
MPILTNLDKFWELLKTANITDVKFVHGNGIVISMADEEIQTRADVASIIATYDPTPSTTQVATINRKANAKNDARSVAILSIDTAEDAVAYVEANSGNVPAIKELVKLLFAFAVALRNEIHPDLPDIPPE